MTNIVALPAPGYVKVLLEEIESLKGALQAALLSLGTALDLLAPPANPDKAWGFIEDAMTVLSEELDDDPETTA